jgi:hypothetical protein
MIFDRGIIDKTSMCAAVDHFGMKGANGESIDFYSAFKNLVLRAKPVPALGREVRDNWLRRGICE